MFAFDIVFGKDSTQESVCNECAAPLIEKIFNGTILCTHNLQSAVKFAYKICIWNEKFKKKRIVMVGAMIIYVLCF